MMLHFFLPLFNILYNYYNAVNVSVLKANIWAISSDTHQLQFNQSAPIYNIIIIFDTVLRRKGNFEHEK